MPTATGLLTYEDSLLRPESRFEEIVRGELSVMPPGSLGHAQLIELLREMLSERLRGTPLFVSHAGIGIGIAKEPFHYRVPDLVVLTAAASRASGYYWWESPLFVAECLSPSNRKGDPAKLMREYLSIGTVEAWAIDPQLHKFSRYYATQKEPEIITGDAVVSLAIHDLPDISVPLAGLWAAFEGR